MQFLTDTLVFILTTYLALANGLADHIETALYQEEEVTVEELLIIPNSENQELEEVESSYKFGGAIPKILIENTSYQKASVVESTSSKVATATALDALVNIYCTYRNGNTQHVTTGTGFFINTNGVILTNAHVAQFLLLEGVVGETECIIRTGNPAVPMYTAELLYISPTWIRENANLLNNPKPRGTGERDYALLYITAGINKSPMPSKFPALPVDTSLLKNDIVGITTYAAGYPAKTLVENGFETALIPKRATTTIAELMTFGSNYADIFSIRGSVIGERGSSGGPVVNTNGDAIGLISTRGDDSQFGKGALRAITLSYIDRTIQEETGFTLEKNIGGDVPYRASIFTQTMVPFLQLLMKQGL